MRSVNRARCHHQRLARRTTKPSRYVGRVLSRDASLVDLIGLWVCIIAAVAVQETWGPLWGVALLVPAALLVLFNPRFWR